MIVADGTDDAAGACLPGELVRVREWLSSVTDVEGLSRGDCLAVVSVAEEIKGAVAAVQARATVAFVEDVEESAAQARSAGEVSRSRARRRASAARSEVALARRCSPWRADRHVAAARAWCTVLPGTMAALTAGRVSEARAEVVARETTCLSPEDRREADRRLAGDLSRLGDRALAGAARRLCADLDPESVVARNDAAVASRRVSTRPAPDGMAWLSILGEMPDVVGAFAALTKAEAARWRATGDPVVDAERAADERSRGAWMADRALELLSGRGEGQVQPVEVGLVMDPETLLGDDDHDRGCPHSHDDDERGRAPGAAPGAAAGAGRRGDGAVEVPGWGPVPPSRARARLLALLDQLDSDNPEGSGVGVAVRRLFTAPGGADLVAMDSRQRFFTGALRALIETRDGTCRIPWCDAPTREVDHAHRAVDGGATSAVNGWGLCQRHNLDKETPGWSATVTSTGLDPGGGPHEVRLSTPHTGEHDCPAPPLLGTGRTRPRIGESTRQPGHPPDTTRSRYETHLAWLIDAA